MAVVCGCASIVVIPSGVRSGQADQLKDIDKDKKEGRNPFWSQVRSGSNGSSNVEQWLEVVIPSGVRSGQAAAQAAMVPLTGRS